MNTTHQQELLTRPLYNGIRLVWYIIDIIESLLFIRLLLIFFGANPTAQFTEFIYEATYPLVQPFLHVFSSYSFARMTIDWGTLLAMAAYWIVTLIIIKLLFFIINFDIRDTVV